MLLPALGMARDAAKTSTCSNNLKQIGAAMNIYAGDNDGFTPSRLINVGYGNAGWMYLLSAYLPGAIKGLPFEYSETFKCPTRNKNDTMFSSGLSYGISRYAAEFRISRVRHPVQTLFSSEEINPVYGGVISCLVQQTAPPKYFPMLLHAKGCNLLFFDTHVKWSKEPPPSITWKTAFWSPQY